MTAHSCSAICKVIPHRTATQQVSDVCWGHSETRFLSGWLQWLKLSWFIPANTWLFSLPLAIFFFFFEGVYWVTLNMHCKNTLNLSGSTYFPLIRTTKLCSICTSVKPSTPKKSSDQKIISWETKQPMWLMTKNGTTSKGLLWELNPLLFGQRRKDK